VQCKLQCQFISRILHLLRTLLAAHGARTRAAHHEHDPVEHDEERPARHEQRVRIAGRADSVGAVGGAPGLGGDGGVGERHGERDAEPEHREARRHERALVAEALRGGGERDEEQEEQNAQQDQAQRGGPVAGRAHRVEGHVLRVGQTHEPDDERRQCVDGEDADAAAQADDGGGFVHFLGRAFFESGFNVIGGDTDGGHWFGG
jgi:hypothetical protein